MSGTSRDKIEVKRLGPISEERWKVIVERVNRNSKHWPVWNDRPRPERTNKVELSHDQRAVLERMQAGEQLRLFKNRIDEPIYLPGIGRVSRDVFCPLLWQKWIGLAPVETGPTVKVYTITAAGRAALQEEASV